MAASWVRYIILIVAVLNAVLNLIGFETISDELTSDIVAFASGIFILYTGWKNQYLSKKGVKQAKALEVKGLK